MSFADLLTEPLASSASIKALDNSLSKNRLPHAILFHCDNIKVLEEVSLALASNLLKVNKNNLNSDQTFFHPDLFVVRPSNKMRRISVKSVREMIRQIQFTSHQGGAKVAIIHEADRMNQESANAFLKTLEEPPVDSTILLFTTRLYDLLPTIRSRCINFRLPSVDNRIDDEDWSNWLNSYNEWLVCLLNHEKNVKNRSKLVLNLYGLIYQFQIILKKLSSAAWNDQKKQISPDISSDIVDALEVGVFKSIRQQIFCEIEIQTSQESLINLEGSDKTNQKIINSISVLESIVGLLEVNLKEDTALEYFLLSSLKIWSAK